MADDERKSPTFTQFFTAATRGEDGKGRSPFPYQRRLAEDGLPDVLLAPTGAGKTDAAILAWWWRRRFHRDPKVRAAEPRRLVYCLPMRVLVEQTLTRFRTWAANCSSEFEPPPAVVSLMGGNVDDAWMNDPVSDAVIIGTQDMLLSRALNRGYTQSRYAWPRAFGLLNNDAVWIVDETQLFGVGLATTTQLAGLRRRLGTFGPTHTLWMSATLDEAELRTVDAPHELRIVRLDDHDLHHDELRRRRVARKVVEHIPAAEVDVAEPDWTKKLADRIAARVRGGGCAGNLTLVVVNRVRSAVEICAALRNNLSGGKGKSALPAVAAPPDVVLLHARFRPNDRRILVQRLLDEPPPEGRVVISTQVVEAGVDVSATLLVTQSAPWSSMVQRFGRCNRLGVDDGARIWWFGAKASATSDKWAAPYDSDDIRRAEKELRDLDGRTASPEALSNIKVPRDTPLRPCLRRTDVIDLFDTTSDLTGGDIDVSRFIRDADDRDAHVYWRAFEPVDKGGRPPADSSPPTRDELCAVGIGDLRAFLDDALKAGLKKRGWIWDYLDARWRPALKEDVRPGAVLLFHASVGGYTPERGFDPKSKTPVIPVPINDHEGAGEAASWGSTDADDSEMSGDDDPRSYGVPVSLSRHASDVAAEADALAAALAPHIDGRMRIVLRSSGRFHDLGKAHPAFQAMLRSDPAAASPPEGLLLAKSGSQRGGRNPRRYFRHELASALVVARLRPEELGLREDYERDLCAYLVASHHGKVRLAIRPWPDEPPPIGYSHDVGRQFGNTPKPGQLFALGVWQDDALPEVDLGGGVMIAPTTLDLSISRLGHDVGGTGSWIDRMIRLRDADDDARPTVPESTPRIGPFRLGFLEAVLRAADVRATIAERTEGRRNAEVLG